MKKSQINIQEEVARCLLCENAPCSKACGKGDVARALRAVRFDNEAIARQWLEGCDDSDLEKAEQACIHYDRPIRIREIVSQLPEATHADLPSLAIDFCGMPCENPFFLASSSICTNYEMVLAPSRPVGLACSIRPSAWMTSTRCRHALMWFTARETRATSMPCATWSS